MWHRAGKHVSIFLEGAVALKPTSRRNIKSFTMLMTFPIVASIPPSPFSGHAKSIVWPFRSRPRERSWLLIYSDAVRRLSDSMLSVNLSGSWAFVWISVEVVIFRGFVVDFMRCVAV